MALKRITVEDIALEALNAKGVPGPDGTRGQKGDKGDKGEKGDTGNTGLNGRDGIDGMRGVDGIQGERGKEGDEGERGELGQSGRGGATGDVGPIPAHKWRDTALTWQIGEEEDGSILWGKPADLQGRPGADGKGGSSGGGIMSAIRQARDTDIPTPADGEVLTFDTASGKWISAAAAGGVTDHGALTGLLDDDHPQYAEIASAETISGVWDFTTQPTGIDHLLALRQQMSTRTFVSSDFIEPPGTFAGLQVTGLLAINASGGFVNIPTSPYDFTNHPGVWGLNTGTTSTTGRVFLLSQFPGGFHVGVGGITRFGAWYQSPAVASVALNRYVLRAGLSSVILPNSLAQAITFEAVDNENGGRWQALTEDGIGETSVDTGVTVGTGKYVFLEFEVNAAGTSVEFFIDGVSVATITTNIPSGTGFNHFINIHIMKLTGTALRASYTDAYYFQQDITR